MQKVGLSNHTGVLKTKSRTRMFKNETGTTLLTLDLHIQCLIK